MLFTNQGNVNINAGVLVWRVSANNNGGNYTIANGAKLTGTSAFGFSGTTFTNNGTCSLNIFKFMGSSTQFLNGNGTITNLEIDNSSGVMVGGNQMIGVTLTLTNGNITLGYNYLTVIGNLSGGSASSYILTNGTGFLRRSLHPGAAPIFYPVGTATSFAPVTLSNLAFGFGFGIAIDVRVIDSVYNHYDPNLSGGNNPIPIGNPISNFAINKTWIIPGTYFGATADATFQWNASDEMSGFNRNSCRNGMYHLGWQVAQQGASAGAGPYSKTVSISLYGTHTAFSVFSTEISCTNSFTANCSGSTISIPYTATGYFAGGNIFSAQLSNSSGSFAGGGVNIGSVTSTTSGTINATIPLNTPIGGGYRVRVVSSKPFAFNSFPDNGSDISITQSVLYYADNDADGFGNADVTIHACTPPAGYVLDTTDCNDSSAVVYPGATEVCDGLDNDCDGQVDEGLMNTFYEDQDGDTYGAGIAYMLCANYNNPTPGYSQYNTDCDDTNPAIHQTFGFYTDADGDGFGAGNLLQVCAVNTTTPPSGYSITDNDCDDNNANMFPGSTSLNRPFRSKQNGDWASPSTWEYGDGCNWVTGGVPSESDGEITISHDVTVTSLGVTDGDQIVITATGSLIINSRFFLRDGPGDDLLNNSGDGITINNGGILSGTGTVNNQGRADVHGVGTIAVPFVNNGNFFFTHATEGCCPSGLINLSDGITTGRIDNHGSFFIYATPGISVMNILNGEFYNHTDGIMNMEYTTAFTVNRFTNEGEFFLVGASSAEYICTINSTESAIHRGRFKSNGNNKKFVLNTNGIFTYASDCIIDGNMHYHTGTHEIFSTYFGPYDSRVSTTVNCNGTEMNFPGNVYVDARNFGGPAVKKIGGSLIWWAGTVSGGNLIINDTATAHFGAGQTTFGTLATTLVNNGTINLFTAHGGCCTGPVFNMTNGNIENNGQFIFHPTGGGGIYNETLSGGTFNNNTAGTLINNLTASGQWGDNGAYLRNTVFTNNGTILANGVSLNIFPTTDPVITGTITVAAGAMVKFGIPSTTTTISSNAIMNGAGTIYFFEGNHQVYSNFYDAGITQIGQTYSPANVYFNKPDVALNYVYMTSGILGGTATKLLKDDMVFIYGQITGGPISNTDTSVFHYGAGNLNLGALNTAFINNGTLEVNAYHDGCCSGPTIDLISGSITNNKTFNVTGSGGIYYVALNNGSFINNATGVINSNIGDVAFGERVFRMQPASFTNHGTIIVLRNIMELGAFTVGGEINVSPNSILRSTGTITFDGSLINNDGNITAPFNFITAPAKILKGTGNFNCNMVLNNTSTVTPGSSPGILTVAGNYTQGDAALDIEIAGTNAGTEHDRLVVTGTATLSGTLNATEINGYDPQTTTTIDIITAEAVAGTFSTVNLPPFWSVKYFSNKVSLVKFFEYVYYRDADNDDYGNPADFIQSFETTAPTGYTVDSTDCDDTNSAINPGAAEVCDGVDNDCDGNTDVIVTNGIVCGMAYSEG